MKIASLTAALVVTAALTAFGQEGVVQDVKHGAKKQRKQLKTDWKPQVRKQRRLPKRLAGKQKRLPRP